VPITDRFRGGGTTADRGTENPNPSTKRHEERDYFHYGRAMLEIVVLLGIYLVHVAKTDRIAQDMNR